mmetsp:Transcript_10953/g.24113  ORF Transcript_10953/g.24113 Transcript_10953/m.24113 type:complete len:86 (+) Transcript_10953:97-354(+)
MVDILQHRCRSSLSSRSVLDRYRTRKARGYFLVSAEHETWESSSCMLHQSLPIIVFLPKPMHASLELGILSFFSFRHVGRVWNEL